MANYYDSGDRLYTNPSTPPPETATPIGGAAQGAAVGSAAGPYGAIIGALAGLLGGIMNQKDAEKARKLAYDEQQKLGAQNRLYGMQQQQINTAGEMGNREQSAIQQMMGVLSRSMR